MTKYIIGTSGWNYPDWRGKFYPKDLAQKNWLEFYQTRFSIVEINATFYRLFNKKVFQQWRARAEKNFYYVIKVNRYITHIKYLKTPKKSINRFCKMVSHLDDRLALILLQLPPSMPYDVERLRKAILCFPEPRKIIVEFRDPKWFTKEVKNLLTELGCIFCITDSPTIKLKSWVTSDVAYIRMHGRTTWFDYNYTRKELQSLAQFAKRLAAKGAKQIYILFNNDYYSYAANNALYLDSLLNKRKK